MAVGKSRTALAITRRGTTGVFGIVGTLVSFRVGFADVEHLHG